MRVSKPVALVVLVSLEAVAYVMASRRGNASEDAPAETGNPQRSCTAGRGTVARESRFDEDRPEELNEGRSRRERSAKHREKKKKRHEQGEEGVRVRRQALREREYALVEDDDWDDDEEEAGDDPAPRGDDDEDSPEDDEDDEDDEALEEIPVDVAADLWDDDDNEDWDDDNEGDGDDDGDWGQNWDEEESRWS